MKKHRCFTATKITFCKIMIAAFTVMLSAGLCACAGPQSGESGNGTSGESEWTVAEAMEGIWWVQSEQWEIPIQGGGSRTVASVNDAVIYVDDEASGKMQLKICAAADRGVVNEEELSYPEAADMKNYFLLRTFPSTAQDGDFWGLWMVGTGANAIERHELVRYNQKGIAQSIIELKESVISSNPSDIVQVADTKEACYLLISDAFSDNRIITLTLEGEFKTSEPIDGEMFFLQGNIYLAKSREAATALYLFAGDSPETVPDGVTSKNPLMLPVVGNLFFQVKEGDICMSDGDCLYIGNLEEKKLERILKWDESGLQPTNICAVLQIEQDRISVLSNENGVYRVYVLSASDHPDERIKLTIIGNRFEWHLAEWINGFNQSNDEYWIVLKDPGFAELEYDELQTRLKMMLTSDENLDLVDVGDFERWTEMAKNGAFADLTPFLNAGSPIKESDYLPNIWACGTVDDKQIFIPYSFGFSMLFGLEDYVGSSMGWTLEELLAASEKHSEIPVFEYGSSVCLYKLLKSDMEEFVDKSNRTCDFENELFYDVLECAARADKTLRPMNDYLSWSPFDCVVNKRSLLGDIIQINTIEDYLAYQSVIPMGNGESVKLVLKGYPDKDGKARGYGSMVGATRLAICGGSSHKEGAWKFIEYVIEETWGDIYSGMEFPAKTDRMRDSFLHEGQDIKNMDYKGIEFRDVEEEDLAAWMEIVAGVKFENEQDDIILQIIKEEAGAFLSGQRTKEDVAAFIQSRVQLYLAE